ncbi:MAG: Fe-S cluster assembly ATPase SufC [Thermoproteota archaeon]|nr:Fe-S cluster assembly ATPase SufC [Thermoproteota archaeon]
MHILEVRDLVVGVEGKTILSGVNLILEEKESYIMFGPNGSGKSTLINTIMGIKPYEVSSGNIVFMGEDITNKSVDERAKLGISLGFQYPPEITGIKLSDLLKICLDKDLKTDFNQEEKSLIEAFRLSNFLERNINVGFSGGERKRAELLQMIFLKPKLLLLDEPDSGVDVESLKLIASEIQKYIENSGSSTFIVTHKGDILDYIKSKHACILLDSKIHCFPEPRHIYELIKKKGYDECVSCQEKIIERWNNV